jgi:hypothetical protein
MTIRSYSAFPRAAEETILVGYACKIGTGAVALLDDATQATTVTVKPLGISATEAADDDEIAVINFGDAIFVAGTSGVTAGDYLVAEAGTGKLITYVESAYADGQLVNIIGRALETVAADARGLCFVSIYTFSVSEPA